MNVIEVIIILVLIGKVISAAVEYRVKKEQEILLCRYCYKVQTETKHSCISMQLAGVCKKQTVSIKNTNHFVSIDEAEKNDDWRRR